MEFYMRSFRVSELNSGIVNNFYSTSHLAGSNFFGKSLFLRYHSCKDDVQQDYEQLCKCRGFFSVRGRHPTPVKRGKMHDKGHILGKIFYECCFTSLYIYVTHIIPYYTISCIEILYPCTK